MLNKLLGKKSLLFIFFIIIVFVSLIFRFYNLNWDNGLNFHPDERNIDNAVTKIEFFSNLNPHFFAYGGFPIYLYRASGDLINIFLQQEVWTTDWGHINLIGRFFSAFFSLLTLIPIYFLTKKISNRKSAMVAIFLFAFTVTSIQTAHFAVTESLITLIGVLICLLSIKLIEKNDLKKSILLGVVVGIGIASKISAAAFIIMPLLSFFLVLKADLENYKKIILNITVSALTGFIIFFLFSPFTFLDFNKFMESMRYESGVATGVLPVVYTFQFDGTIPYLFWIQNIFWQVGIVAIFCVLGVFTIFYKMLKEKRRDLLIFASFPVLYFLYVGIWHTKFIRYIVPIIPFFLICASIFLTGISARLKTLGNIILLATTTFTAIWAIAFFSIYLNPQTRTAASAWIYNNIPSGSKILTEQWDDGLPVPVDSQSPRLYQSTALDMYSRDDQSKIDYLATNLNQADYIIFNSRRLYGTLIKLKQKYPVTSNYYKLLFRGELGYKKIKEFSSYPTILGISINDDPSEETFQVYDHPKIIIFRNDMYISKEQLQKILRNEIIP